MNSPNADGWVTHAPAKVNLDLHMLGRRADGYHLLSTALQSIALADTLTLTRHAGPFRLTCDAPGVPTDARNLAWRGAAAMAAAVGMSLDGWRLHLDKAIPAEAGLGGGSSDAVAAARLVATAAGTDMPPARLASAVAGLGADVPFFAWGGCVRGEGVGDELTPLPDLAAAAVVVVRPPFGVPTADAYGWYDADCAAGGARSMAGPAAGAVPAATAALVAVHNDLQGPVGRRHPEILSIVSRLRGAGAWGAAMSGSGSACFGLFDPARDVTDLANGWPAGTRVWLSALLSRAAYVDAVACVPLP